VRKIVLVLFNLLSIAVFGQGDYRFNNYTISQGLSQSFVTAVIQDNQAGIWVGTQDGLNRFDGRTFEVFHADETPGIENAYIHCAAKTPDGKLWFGTSDGLLNYNPSSGKFTSFQLGNQALLPFESIGVSENQKLWLGVNGYGLVSFDTEKGVFGKRITKLPSKRVHFVSVVDSDNLLVYTDDKGLFSIQIKSGLVQPIKFPEKRKSVSVLKMIREKDGTILLGTNQGVFSWKKGNILTHEMFPFLRKEQLNVTDIVHWKDRYFIATASKGLYTVYPDGSYYSSTVDIFQRNSLLFNGLTVLFTDKNEKIWVGSERGLSTFDPERKGFLSVGPSGNLNKGLPASNVWCFGEDQSGRYKFIGTDVGITRWDRKTGEFKQFFRTIGASISSETGREVVLSMHVISARRILVGALDGLYELQIRPDNSYVFKPLKYIDAIEKAKHDRIYKIVQYDENRFFLATKSGIILYDLNKNKTQIFEHQPNNVLNSPTIGICRVIYKDDFGKFWFATSGGGINLLDEKNGQLFIKPFPLNSIIASKSKDYVTSIVATNSQELWLGTFGSGLLRLNLKNKTCFQFTRKEGLPNNAIYGIIEDGKNRIWMSTNRGLACYDIKNNKFNTFSEINGLVSNEFNANAYLKSSRGELMFGGIEGFNYFFPELITKPSNNTKVIINKIFKDKKWQIASTVLKEGNDNNQYLILDYKQRSFGIKFHSDDLSSAQLINYRFQLISNETVDQSISDLNELSFNSLSSGNYTLKLFSRIGDGPWSNSPTIIFIKILPPFWLTWWFWVAFSLMVLLLIFAVIRWRLILARKHQRKLEIKIAKRTKEISIQKTKIEQQKELIEAEKNNVIKQQELLQEEKDKAEKWLANALPKEAIIELKRVGKVQAQSFKQVTVLFTDVVGFSKISERTAPNRLVTKLDVLFRKFDDIIQNNRLEKIKTIGDAYMCAGGVPTKNSTHPIDACIAAIQIQDYMARLKFEALANYKEYWEIRLGINTGPVTAGIIGNLRLAYDIWGSTVNLAQRMEMMGQPGKVTISKNTFELIEPYFECSYVGKVETKSKSFVDAYEVLRIKPELSINGEGLVPNNRFGEIVKLHHFSSIKYYKTEHYVLNILKKKLSKDLIYHSLEHTKDVVKAVERIALLEGVTDEGLFLLKTAAILHDAGFIEQYEHNEPIGARMAKEILPKYGYTEQHINTIVDLIHVTAIPHKPINKLQEIICDADLDYLGRDDFETIADRLRRELRAMGKIDSDRKWDEIQVHFLRQHQYFTKTAIESRQAKKEANIQKVLNRLSEGKYLD